MSLVMPQLNKEFAIGLDIGGTKILAGLVNGEGKMISQIHFATMPESGVETMLSKIVDALISLKQEAIFRGGNVRGVGIACTGVVDSYTNSIVYAKNLGWRNVPVGQYIFEILRLPVRIGNDANLAAVAEYMWGDEEKVEDIIYVTVSTGVGAGIVSGGQLVSGNSEGAGEFGHISLDPKGSRCGCGNYGCLENFSSGTAIAYLANFKKGSPGRMMTTKDVIDAANSGEKSALDIVRNAGFYLGNGLITLIHLFNPKRIVLGGGVMANGNLLYDEMEKTIHERCMPSLRKDVKLCKTTLGKEIGVLGAAGLYFMPN
ncbi:MAG: ROK family protein [Candidatus Cohnella colombiensis]|uniref:ROK family protein n=1 Tax=Candidatus Cohnella colombiensis TaxID=3121368 RepID=A0AA95JED1_9BACL|nr:MAG: ROK family protein [Cohnella sp.]